MPFASVRQTLILVAFAGLPALFSALNCSSTPDNPSSSGGSGGAGSGGGSGGFGNGGGLAQGGGGIGGSIQGSGGALMDAGAGGGTCVGDPACVCPDKGPIAGYAEHDGLRPIDPSNFALVDTNTWASSMAIIDGLGLPFIALDAITLNRTATKPDAALAADLATVIGYQGAFEWESGDQNVSYWIPQGLSGAKVGARDYVMVSWHYDEANIGDDPNPSASGDKGVRLSLADMSTLGGDVLYRHILLVSPDAAKGFVSVNIHAGGIAFFGPYLYVADTSRGVRVFDTTRLMAVSTSAACSSQIGKAGVEICAYGYAYALPQVGGFYYPAGTDASCRALFSFLSLDLSTSPPSLISGEYDNDPNLGIYSRLLRFPLDETSHRLLTDGAGAAHATGAWYAGNRNIQGAAAIGGKFFINATRYSGALFTGKEGELSQVYQASQGKWGWMPEGIHYDGASGRVFINTEGHANMPRLVFAAKAASIP